MMTKTPITMKNNFREEQKEQITYRGLDLKDLMTFAVVCFCQLVQLLFCF